MPVQGSGVYSPLAWLRGLGRNRLGRELVDVLDESQLAALEADARQEPSHGLAVLQVPLGVPLLVPGLREARRERALVALVVTRQDAQVHDRQEDEQHARQHHERSRQDRLTDQQQLDAQDHGVPDVGVDTVGQEGFGDVRVERHATFPELLDRGDQQQQPATGAQRPGTQHDHPQRTALHPAEVRREQLAQQRVADERREEERRHNQSGRERAGHVERQRHDGRQLAEGRCRCCRRNLVLLRGHLFGLAVCRLVYHGELLSLVEG